MSFSQGISTRLIRVWGTGMAAPHSTGEFDRDVVVIGGCGHVGLPLAIAFADRGARVSIYDVSQPAVDGVNAGRLPFDEPGAAPLLERAVAAGRLRASTDASVVGSAEHVIVVIGTPVDEHLNPNQTAIPRLSLIHISEPTRLGMI